MKRIPRSTGRGKNLVVLNHPLLHRDLTILRDRRTPMPLFRTTLDRCSRLLASEVSGDLKTRPVSVQTPLARAAGVKLERNVVLIPILRAGLGMVEGFLGVFPDAKVGHVGLYRDEDSLQPVEYYFNIPNPVKEGIIYVLDPMLATGGSAVAAISALKRKGGKEIRLVSLLAAPEGIRNVNRSHPGVCVFTCSVDRKLNERGYIVPGLGDAGDRLFGTE